MKPLLAILPTLAGIVCVSNANEVPIILDLIEDLEIRSCFLVKEYGSSLNLLSTEKVIFKNITTAHISYQKLTEYVVFTEHTNDGISIILMEEDVAEIEVLSQHLDLVNQTYKLCKFKWVVFIKKLILTLNPEKLRIPYNCEFFIIQPDATSSYKLFEYYTTTNRFFVHNFGTWNDHYGLKTTDVSSYWRRLDLNHTKITILAEIKQEFLCKTYPHIMLCQTDIILHDFGRMMNFDSYVIYLTPNDLKRSEIFEEHQANILNFPQVNYGMWAAPADEQYNCKLGPIFKPVVNWYIKYPKTILRSDYFIQPFHKNLWITIILFILIGNIFVLILSKLKTGKKSSVVANVFLILETFCNQSSTDDLENAYHKIICILFQFMAIIILGAFGSVIASFVAVEIVQEPFTNVDEFVKNGQYKLQIFAYKFGDAYFRQVYDPMYENFYDNYVLYYNRSEIKAEDYNIICTNDRIVILYSDYHFEKSISDIRLATGLECNIHRISKPLEISPTITLPLEPFSPFMNVFNHNLLRLYESGIQMKMREIVQGKPFAVDKIENTFQSVELAQMVLVLSIPLVGILVATLMFIVELKIIRKKLCNYLLRTKKFYKNMRL